MKIRLDLPQLIDLVTIGLKLTMKLTEAAALARGKTEITIEDLESTRLNLDHALRSGRTVGELRDRLQEIAEGEA